jgi:hypothetical protein
MSDEISTLPVYFSQSPSFVASPAFWIVKVSSLLQSSLWAGRRGQHDVDVWSTMWREGQNVPKTAPIRASAGSASLEKGDIL